MGRKDMKSKYEIQMLQNRSQNGEQKNTNTKKMQNGHEYLCGLIEKLGV